MYIIILLAISSFLTCQSCSMSSHPKEDSYEQSQETKTRKEWSSLDEVGLPIVPDTCSSILLERYCYTTSYNPRTRQPNWVMWELIDEHVMKRNDDGWNEYQEDSELPSSIRSSLNDYASSGYDKGHMCPGGDCNWDEEGRDETYLLSNMCPQNPHLNRGDWKEIEMACRKWAKQYGKVYIVCGPIFMKSQEHERIGPNQIPVPEAFFKVVLYIGPLGSRGIGFICRNTDGNRKKDFYANSIRQVERVTGYRFFTNIDRTIQGEIFDMNDITSW